MVALPSNQPQGFIHTFSNVAIQHEAVGRFAEFGTTNDGHPERAESPSNKGIPAFTKVAAGGYRTAKK